MKKVKKINKIPKYTDGTPAVDEQSWVQRNLGLKKGVAGAGQIAGAVGGASLGIASALGIELGKTGQIISGIGQMASNFGPIGQIVGAGLQTVGAFTGGGGSVDENTGDITKSSGLTRWLGWGRSDESLLRKSNRIKNSNLAREMSANLQAEWANNPNVEAQPAVLAKDGGIVPGEHYSSRNEVEVDANGNNAVRYKWDPKGKDTYHIMFNPDGSLTEGNMIFNDEGVRRPDGTKYSDTADKMIKNIKDPKLRKISLKKLAAEQEVEKEKEGKIKNGIPAHEGGNNGKSSRWSDRARNYMESVIEPAIVDYVHRATYDPYGFSGSTFIPADRRIIGDEIEKELLKFNDPNVPITLGTMTGTTISPDKAFIKQTTSPTTIGYDQSFNRYSPIGQALGQFGSDFKLFGEGALKPRRNLFSFAVQNNTINETNASKTGDSDSSSKKITTGNKNKSKTATPVINRDGMWIGNPKKQTFDVPSAEILTKLNNIPKMVRAKDAYAAIGKENTGSDTPLNWGDLAYQAASILTPLLDRENAETTRLQRPTWKGIPVAVDVSNQLQDSQLDYALANYNTAQGGYTAGQQLAARSAAASNLARQRAAIHQWQTEQQNKNIAQNIASYNNYANVIADIANKEIDINAANRAATRNINRQNKATALKNWGLIRKDNKSYEMDKMKLQMIDPMLQYGYENYDNYLKWKKENGYG